MTIKVTWTPSQLLEVSLGHTPAGVIAGTKKRRPFVRMNGFYLEPLEAYDLQRKNKRKGKKK